MCYCAVDRPERRSTFLPAALVISAAVIAGLAIFEHASRTSAAPAWYLNDSATSPVTTVVGGVRYVRTSAAQATLVPDTTSPREGVRLLWLAGRTAQPTPSGAVVLAEDGGVVEVDARLNSGRLAIALGGREPLSVAARGAGGLWVSTDEGEVLRVGASGVIEGVIESGPFAYSSVVAAPEAKAWLVRSSSRFSYRLDPGAPLLVRLNQDGRMDSIGHAQVPEHALLLDLANAGNVAVRGDLLYYAPFIRDEVVALNRNGDTIWVASRQLPQSTSEPRFELANGKPVVNYHPVNLGIVTGLDGNVYVLSTPGFTTSRSRLDVFDPLTGELLRSALLPTALPTLASSVSGRVYLLDAGTIASGAGARPVESISPARFPVLDGDTSSVFAAGHVTLVNVWASWCKPCREEMPALDSLWRTLRDNPAFRFVTVNEDLQADRARRFTSEFGFNFPVLLGRGRARKVLHYPGLPHTLLVGAGGEVLGKWSGYRGAVQVAEIDGAVRAALRKQSAATTHVHH